MCNYILPNLAGLFFVLFAYFLLFSRLLIPVCKTCNEYFDTVFYHYEMYFSSVGEWVGPNVHMPMCHDFVNSFPPSA